MSTTGHGNKSPQKATSEGSRLASDSPSADDPPEDEAGQDAKERRREQVRRAQRTHRDRKATYVKALEMEVAKLRAKDAHYSSELRHSKTVIRKLEEVLAANGISMPTDLLHVDYPLATIELVGRPPFGQSLQAQMPTFDHSAPAPHLRGSVLAQNLPPPTESETTSSTAPVSDTDAMAWNTDAEQLPTNHPFGLDATQIGINFVLALEHSCLYHHGIPSVPMLAHGDIGYGHSLMLSSPIMEHSPKYSLNPLKLGFAKGATWTVPAVELEKLLSFSDQIELEGEITPVQVWHTICRHPNFHCLTPERLEALRDALQPSVKCLGFGAVIDQAFFEDQLAKAMKIPREA